MTFKKPEAMPARSDFLITFLDSIFPDLDVSKLKKGPYAYTVACEQAAKELGIPYCDELVCGAGIDPNSNLFRLMYEMNDASKVIFGKDSSLISDEEYKNYTGTLFTFCSQTSGSLKGWLKKTSDSNRINKSFDAALFFTYLLLSRTICKDTRVKFFKYCLSCIGIEDIEYAIEHKLYSFNWNEVGEKDVIGGIGFDRLNNKAIVMLGITILTIMELIGTYSAERDFSKIQIVHKIFSEYFSKEQLASEMFDSAVKAMLNSNKFFEPRSIQTAKKLYPQDFYVIPRFFHAGKEAPSPVLKINNSTKSKRLLIMAKTGLGKSAYLQMVTLCMLKKRYGLEGVGYEGLDEISKNLNIPDDMYIISVPARMFSFCYKDERYREWTHDFITLFCNSMWKLSSGFNFYSTQNSQRFSEQINSISNTEYLVTEELIEYIQELARAGKLLLVLDSFDEISSGEMRKAYINTLTSFYDRYCCYLEEGDVGAHVIVSSREMSPKTMHSLEDALELDHESEIFRIESLSQEQREQLVYKWHRFMSIPDEESKAILNQIAENHYYLEYTVNPYMLSVVCFYFGHDLGSITQRFINTLVDRMLKNNRTADPVIQDVLMNIVKIFQEIAGETITTGNPHFSRQKLDRYLNKMIDKTDLSEDAVEEYIERLHEIFVTEVGLIVPADGDDSDYQFINNQIRYELSAKGIQRALEDDEKASIYREIIFPSIKNVGEYVGLLVPLLCDINLENLQLAELLISDLVMYEFHDDEEEKMLIQTMLDLLLNRYGSNIITAVISGKDVARFVNRAQRMLLIRLFSSQNFQPSVAERESIKSVAAFKNNKRWLSDKLLKTIL